MECEEAITQAWREVFRRQDIGRDENFFEMGGDSILGMDVAALVAARLKVEIPIVALYQNPTIRELAEFITSTEAPRAEEFVDLSREAVLAADIVPAIPVSIAPERRILLTGATGFVGRFVLSELLRSSQATLFCLVRAQSDGEASRRLENVLKRWNLWEPACRQRVRAIAGDLQSPRLGVDAATYRKLCDEIETIYNCATSMNHLETYAAAKIANVQGLEELLRLTTLGSQKVLQHVSTLSVFSPIGGDPHRVVNEISPIDDEKHRVSQGYLASKWVGEKLVMTAAERGIPCNIFRLGLIWADGAMGRYDELQHVYRIIQSSLITGFGIRRFEWDFVPTPVDLTARAVVRLGTRHRTGGRIFHIESAGEMLSNVFERCNEVADTGLELLSFFDWIAEIKRLRDRGRLLSALPVVDFAFSMTEQELTDRQASAEARSVRRDCARTHRELDDVGVPMQVDNNALLRRCVEDMCFRDAEVREAIQARRKSA